MKRKIHFVGMIVVVILMLGSCTTQIPEHASPYWALRDSEEFQIDDGIVSFYSGKMNTEGYDDSGLSIPFEYSHLFHENGSYLQVRVDRIRQVRVVEEATFLSFGDHGEKYFEKRPEERKFSVMQATVLQVFRNAEWSDFKAGDVLMIHTEYLPEITGQAKTAVAYHAGGVYYMNPARIVQQTDGTAEVMTIQELADYSASYTSRYVFEQKGNSVSVPRCIWEGEGFDTSEGYQMIRVSQKEFESFYENKIAEYSGDGQEETVS